MARGLSLNAKARRTLAHPSGLHLSARHDSPPRPPKYTGQCPHVLSSPASHLPPTSPCPAPSLAIARIIVAGNLWLTAGSDTNTSYVRGIGGLEGHSMWILAPAFLAIYIAFTASPAAPAEYTRSGSVIYITGEIGPYDYVDRGGGASGSECVLCLRQKSSARWRRPNRSS